MKKILSTIAVLAMLAISVSGASFSWAPTTGGMNWGTSNRASVYQVEISATAPVVVNFYDMDTTNAPYYGSNFVTSAYSNRFYVTTNYVTSFVGNNGYTNWYTNAGIWTYTNAVPAATNIATPLFSVTVAAGQYAVYNVDALFARGICYSTTTNANIIVNYRTGQ